MHRICSRHRKHLRNRQLIAWIDKRYVTQIDNIATARYVNRQAVRAGEQPNI